MPIKMSKYWNSQEIVTIIIIIDIFRIWRENKQRVRRGLAKQKAPFGIWVMLILSFNYSFLLTGEIVVERNLSLAQIFKRHPRQKYGGAQKIFKIFSAMK